MRQLLINNDRGIELFVMQRSSLRVEITEVTSSPDSAWILQIARNLYSPSDPSVIVPTRRCPRREPVDVRRLVILRAIRTAVHPTHVVHEKDNDVRLSRSRRQLSERPKNDNHQPQTEL